MIAAARRGDTVLRNSPAYNPQSNGGAEKAVQDVTDLMRRMLLGIKAKLSGRLLHAALVLTRFQVADGLTPWRRFIGRAWKCYVSHFGEKVLETLAPKKPSTNRKVSRGKKKIAARSLPGVRLVVYPRAGEPIIAV